MKSQSADVNFFKVRTADKRLYLGLLTVGLLFLVSYSLKHTSFAQTLGLATFEALPEVLSYVAKALLLLNLVTYIIQELSADD